MSWPECFPALRLEKPYTVYHALELATAERLRSESYGVTPLRRLSEYPYNADASHTQVVPWAAQLDSTIETMLSLYDYGAAPGGVFAAYGTLSGLATALGERLVDPPSLLSHKHARAYVLQRYRMLSACTEIRLDCTLEGIRAVGWSASSGDDAYRIAGALCCGLESDEYLVYQWTSDPSVGYNNMGATTGRWRWDYPGCVIGPDGSGGFTCNMFAVTGVRVVVPEFPGLPTCTVAGSFAIEPDDRSNQYAAWTPELTYSLSTATGGLTDIDFQTVLIPPKNSFFHIPMGVSDAIADYSGDAGFEYK